MIHLILSSSLRPLSSAASRRIHRSASSGAAPRRVSHHSGDGQTRLISLIVASACWVLGMTIAISRTLMESTLVQSMLMWRSRRLQSASLQDTKSPATILRSDRISTRKFLPTFHPTTLTVEASRMDKPYASPVA